MFLSKIFLQNFRSYEQKLIEFDSKLNLITGPNGSGKTNILEAIYLLSCGKSFRSSSLAKLINWASPYTFCRAKIHKNDEEIELEVQLVKSDQSSSVGRKFLIQKVEKTRKSYLGVLKVVVFEPEDIRLVTGSPTRRRDYIDSIFTSTQWRYTAALSQYSRALKHRNELLDQIRNGTSSKVELFYWDQALVKNCQIIHSYRQSFFKSANNFFKTHSDPEVQKLFLNYHPSIITAQKLESGFSYDLSRGYTQLGLHRDDFSFDNSIFNSNDKNLAFWGSRGQQRLAVLALRLAQINFIETTYNDTPILLLDDIFSELDEDHQKMVVDICHKYQTFFTSSDNDSASILPNAKIIEL